MPENTKRWSAEKANAWYAELPWQVGFNYLPRSAVNFVDMWHPETFAPDVIEEELDWAEALGFNLLRVNLQYLLWRENGDAHRVAFERFLEIADRHGIKTMPCLFDDCGFSGLPASSHRQPDPVPGLHNGRALASPGREIVVDPTRREDLVAYVEEVVSTFRDDERILIWDLYNEPGNCSVFTGPNFEEATGQSLDPASHGLMVASFAAARDAGPSQPLTVGAWRCWPQGDMRDGAVPFQNEMDQTALELSDIVTFHSYQPIAPFLREIAYLETLGRPIICTEWMARSRGSLVQSHLPEMAGRRIGALNWGFVRGRTQTTIPWPDVKSSIPDYDEERSPWFHDLLHPDGTPFDAEEVRLFTELGR